MNKKFEEYWSELDSAITSHPLSNTIKASCEVVFNDLTKRDNFIRVELDDVIELKRGAHYVVQLPNISVSEIIRLREDFKVLADRAECEIIIVDSEDIEFIEQKDSIQLQAYKEMCEVYEKANELSIDTMMSWFNVFQNIYDICLCERFKTIGFDYHEKHPRREYGNGGQRPFTPRDLIDNSLETEWDYSTSPFTIKKLIRSKVLDEVGEARAKVAEIKKKTEGEGLCR